MKQYECKKGTKQNKYGLPGAKKIARGWGIGIFTIISRVLCHCEMLGEPPPPLSVASNESYAISMGLWNYSLVRLEKNLSQKIINQNNEFMLRI